MHCYFLYIYYVMKTFEDLKARRFWRNQTESRHRDGSEAFYRRKAEEHAQFFLPCERDQPCVDLGCGAGELLVHFKKLINVVVAIDYSSSMLEEAKRRLQGSNISFIEAGAFDYAPTATETIWISTGAVNQYLEREAMDRFLDLFSANKYAKMLFLFDCVDPIRFALLNFGIGYPRPPVAITNTFQRLVGRSKTLFHKLITAQKLLSGALNRPGLRLGDASIGYGYPPAYWRGAADSRDFGVTFASSQAYEYRFHAILRKLRP